MNAGVLMLAVAVALYAGARLVETAGEAGRFGGGTTQRDAWALLAVLAMKAIAAALAVLVVVAVVLVPLV